MRSAWREAGIGPDTHLYGLRLGRRRRSHREAGPQTRDFKLSQRGRDPVHTRSPSACIPPSLVFSISERAVDSRVIEDLAGQLTDKKGHSVDSRQNIEQQTKHAGDVSFGGQPTRLGSPGKLDPTRQAESVQEFALALRRRIACNLQRLCRDC